jgi:hypothetical protein
MAVFHQMGHQSDNLLVEPHLFRYRGAILSPVNYTEKEILRTIGICREIGDFEIIFDPQLYFPRTEREKLKKWDYFPDDVDTVDFSSLKWWTNLIAALARTAERIRPDIICSPVLEPRNFDDEYFDLMLQVSSLLCDRVCPNGFDVYHTALVGTSELADYDRVMAIASIITRTQARGVYLILDSDIRPRLELSDPEELKGALKLINVIESNGIEVTVGFSSSDIILWKAAGASNCATGKFFNLRRFTPSRWDETEGGGGQLPYWFEENLLAFLRESDLIRVEKASLLSEVGINNPYTEDIFDSIEQGMPWVGLSWRFYLYWFADIQDRINKGLVSPLKMVRNADNNWGIIDEKDVILEERTNDGGWIRQWMRALTEYGERW